MNKIYWSVIKQADQWEPMESYWFPFAERLWHTRFRWIVFGYMRLRMWFASL